MTFVIWNAQGLLIDSSSSTKRHLNFLVISGITSDLYIELLSDALKAVQCNVMQCNKLQFSTVQRSEKKIIFNIFTAAVKAVAEGTSKYILLFLFSNGNL